MPNINITVAAKIATNTTPGEVIVCGNSGYTVTFAFDSEWDAATERTARFVYYRDGLSLYQDVEFTGTTVAVPALYGVAYVLVGVYAGDLITTTPAKVLCDRSILCGDQQNVVAPTAKEQLLAMIGDLAKLETTDKSSLVAAINEAAKTGGTSSAGGESSGATVETIALTDWEPGWVAADGTYSSGGTGCTSGYAQISKGKTYTIVYPSSITEVRFAIYDSDKNFLSRIIDGTAVYTATADGYVRITAVDAEGSRDAAAFADVYLTAVEASTSGGSGGADYSFLSGLKYYALGDSIVDYQGTTASPETYSGTDLQGTVHTDETIVGYIQAIEKRYGLVCTNYGAAGHTIVGDYSTLMALDYSNVALVTIAYGVNDARTAVTLGTVNDADGATFAGALNNILRKIYTDNPECRVLVLTPLQRLYVSDFGIATANANGNYLIDFVNMCKKVAEKRSTLCVDMYRASGINQTNLSYYTREGVHPLNTGYLRMTGAIIPVLDGLFAIEYNPFGTMTSTDDTEQEEPDTGSGDNSGGEGDTPTKDPDATAVALASATVTDALWRYDNWDGKYTNQSAYACLGPIELVAGKTYTLTAYVRPDYEVNGAYWGYTHVAVASETASGGAHMLSRGSTDSGEVLTINGNEYKKAIATFVVPTDKTYWIFVNTIDAIDLSNYSLTYI